MPYQHEFAKQFVDRIQQLEVGRKARVLAELKTILQLDDPKEKGGAYFKALWAYPFPPKSAFICRVDEERQQIMFCDIIRL